MSRWFRLYDGFLDDYRVHSLPDESYRAFFGLMAVVSKFGEEFMADEESLAWLLRIPKDRLTAVLAPIRDSGLLNKNNQIKWFSRPAAQRCNTNEWVVLRARVFARDDYTCRYCGERGGKLECDHVIPHSRGGLDTEENLVTACFSCNRAKRNKTPEEWLGNGAHQNNQA